MAGLLNELLNYVDSGKRRVGNFAQMLVEDPETAWEYAKSAAGDQLAEYQQAPGAMVTDVLGVVPLPAAKGLAAAGAAGIIRRGGMPELVAVHQAPLDRYALWAQTQRKLPQEMYSPSIAINKGAISQNFGSETQGTIHFVGRPDALDPARLNARLYNRDAYTPRDSAYAGGRSELLSQNLDTIPATMPMVQYARNFAGDRLRDKELVRTKGYLPTDLRFLESDTANLIQPEHAQALLSSPSFRSFKEFEQNPRGAALLGESLLKPAAASAEARAALFTRLDALAAKHPELRTAFEKGPLDFSSNLAWLKNNPSGQVRLADMYKLPGGDELRTAVREYHKALAYLPSQYAELKVSGPLQIRSNNFSGAIIAPPKKPTRLYQPESVNAIADLLRQRGIPTMINDPAAPLTPQDLGWLARAYSEGVLK